MNDPAPLPSLEPIDAIAGMGAGLFRVLSKAVEDLGLESSTLEEPTRSCLDEWFLLVHRQAPHQRAAPFFPEVHDELTKLWCTPNSAHLCTSASSGFTMIDGADEKLPPLDESVATHRCPPTAIGWKVKVAHPSMPCKRSSALAGHAYTPADQAASALHTMAVLQVFQAKLLRSMDES